eukprot:6753811-Lingulodinium_polyedra.AAC.1
MVGRRAQETAVEAWDARRGYVYDELREQVVREEEESDPVSTDASSESGVPSTLSDFDSEDY